MVAGGKPPVNISTLSSSKKEAFQGELLSKRGSLMGLGLRAQQPVAKAGYIREPRRREQDMVFYK